MAAPISPPPVTLSGTRELPAYISNGLLGLRILDLPLLPGIVLVNGYTGEDPSVRVDAAARAPYPIAGDIGINGSFLSYVPHQARFLEQRYDFATGEVTTRFAFGAGSVEATVEVVSFCSQKQPTLVLQEVAVEVNAACELTLRALVDAHEVVGRMTAKDLTAPGRGEPIGDGVIGWESLGAQSTLGIGHATELLGDAEAERTVADLGLEPALQTQYRFPARPGRRYRLRQIASMVPSKLHQDPHREAARLIARAASDGFDHLRDENRAEWQALWAGRVIIEADDDRWQQLADAAFFYLNASVHPSSPCSTSIFGLAQWHDYHYYYGHVMWDIESFCVPPLLFSQPEAARSLLNYRVEVIDAARRNAKLLGRRGLQYPWESGPRHGEEASPGAGEASWHEDHASLDIAWAFAQFAHATGDKRFLDEAATRVLSGVADWVASRVTKTRRGYEILQSMGIAETQTPIDNDAYTTMAAITVLREAIAGAERLGEYVPPLWRTVLDGLFIQRLSDAKVIRTHDGFHPNEEKGSTPGPLAGLFPLWFEVDDETARQTTAYYLARADHYIGSPMLSALYGVWAAWNGDRRAATRLYEQGYAELVGGRFLQTLEMSPTRYPEKPPAGPFFANLGAFLMGIQFGLTGIRLGPGEPEDWPSRPIVLPAGWRSIEIERAWVRSEPARIVARHGDARATIELPGRRRRRATAA